MPVLSFVLVVHGEQAVADGAEARAARGVWLGQEEVAARSVPSLAR